MSRARLHAPLSSRAPSSTPIRSAAASPLAHQDVGHGPPLVLIHGHPFDRTLWRPQIARFRATHRIVAPDLRGYGRSAGGGEITLLEDHARDVAQLVAALGLARVVLAGISMGGQIALECARQGEIEIAGLILVDTLATADTLEQSEARRATAARLIAEGMAPYAREALRQMLDPANIRALPRTAEHVLRMMKSAPPDGAAASLRGRALRCDYTPLLERIDLPTLVLVGERDTITPVADAQHLHRHLRRSRLVVVPGAGHLPNLERPRQFNRAVAAFLSDVGG